MFKLPVDSEKSSFFLHAFEDLFDVGDPLLAHWAPRSLENDPPGVELISLESGESAFEIFSTVNFEYLRLGSNRIRSNCYNNNECN